MLEADPSVVDALIAGTKAGRIHWDVVEGGNRAHADYRSACLGLDLRMTPPILTLTLTGPTVSSAMCGHDLTALADLVRGSSTPDRDAFSRLLGLLDGSLEP